MVRIKTAVKKKSRHRRNGAVVMVNKGGKRVVVKKVSTEPSLVLMTT